MSTFYVKPEKLDKVLKPIDESKFFQWRETLIDCASQKTEWLDFTVPNYTWTPRNQDRNRGFDLTNNEDKKKLVNLNSFINYVAMYAPGSLVHDIVNESTGMAYIEAKIRSMYQLRNTGSSVFNYYKKSRSFNHAGTQSYQDFYYELRAQKYETLYKEGQIVTFKGKQIIKDEIMSPSIENSIVIDWLSAIDEDLIEEVEQQYARDLESVSLVDIQEIISQGLPALLSKIKTKKDIGAYKVKLESDVSAYNVRGFSQRGRGFNRGSNNRRGQDRKSSNNGGCSLCKSYGFITRAQSHELKDCHVFNSIKKKERGILAMQINATLDGNELEDAFENQLKIEDDNNEEVQWYNGDSD